MVPSYHSLLRKSRRKRKKVYKKKRSKAYRKKSYRKKKKKKNSRNRTRNRTRNRSRNRTRNRSRRSQKGGVSLSLNPAQYVSNDMSAGATGVAVNSNATDFNIGNKLVLPYGDVFHTNIMTVPETQNGGNIDVANSNTNIETSPFSLGGQGGKQVQGVPEAEAAGGKAAGGKAAEAGAAEGGEGAEAEAVEGGEEGEGAEAEAAEGAEGAEGDI